MSLVIEGERKQLSGNVIMQQGKKKKGGLGGIKADEAKGSPLWEQCKILIIH